MMYVWLIVIIFLTIVEVSTINLVSIWFIASGVVSLILSFFTDNLLIQVGVFVLLGIILLITTRNILNKWLKPTDVKTNLDRVIGMTGIVTENISRRDSGEVKVDGKKWTAIADETIKADEVVKIIDIQGVKLKVEKCGE